VREVVVLGEVADDLNEGKAFYDRQESGIGDYFWDSLVADACVNCPGRGACFTRQSRPGRKNASGASPLLPPRGLLVIGSKMCGIPAKNPATGLTTACSEMSPEFHGDGDGNGDRRHGSDFELCHTRAFNEFGG